MEQKPQNGVKKNNLNTKPPIILVKMGVYDKNKKINVKKIVENGKSSIIMKIFVAALLLGILLLIITSILTPKPLVYYFDKNTITTNEQAILKVGVSNPFGQTSRNVIVEVAPEDAKSISVTQPRREIEVLDNFRELSFVINPIKEILPGNYVIRISLTINNQKFVEKTAITIE